MKSLSCMHNRQRTIQPRFDQSKSIVDPSKTYETIPIKSKRSLPTASRVEQKGLIDNNEWRQQQIPRRWEDIPFSPRYVHYMDVD